MSSGEDNPFVEDIRLADQAARTAAPVALKWVLVFVAVCFGFGLLFAACGFASRWAGGTADIASFDNVAEQQTQLLEDYESLEAATLNVCRGRRAVADSSSDDEATQRRSQVLAYEQTFERISADYDRRMRNFFETGAGRVAPTGIPDQAPALNEMIELVGESLEECS